MDGWDKNRLSSRRLSDEWINMSSFVKCMIGIYLTLTSGYTEALVTHGYMTHYYYSHKPVFVNDSMVLELTNRFLEDTPGKDFLTCDVNIITSSSRRLLIHFIALEISYSDKVIDRLHVYDYKSSGEAVRISPVQGLYGMFDNYYKGSSSGVSDYVSSSNRLKLDYQGKPTLAYNGFKILITSFRDSRGDCGRGYIRCNRRDICIPASTWCDGYNNCGKNDESDEANCDAGLGQDWEPLDGQITAVVAASLSCAMFLITAAVVALVAIRITKRTTLNQNITVEFNKRPARRQQSKNGELIRLYSPPAYDVVVGMDEDPPPYTSVTAADDSDTESDDPRVTFRHRRQHSVDNEYTTIEEAQAIRTAEYNQSAPAQLTSVIVTCDIEGNIGACSANLPSTACSTNLPSTSAEEPHTSKEFLEQTPYRLCSSATYNSPAKKTGITRIKEESDEIEHLSSDDSDSLKDENRNKTKRANGNIVSNGVHGNKTNGHLKISYKRSPSKRDADQIEFIDDA